MTLTRIHQTKELDDNTIHQGRNTKNIREMLGWKKVTFFSNAVKQLCYDTNESTQT
jgi:hypothetical protein